MCASASAFLLGMWQLDLPFAVVDIHKHACTYISNCHERLVSNNILFTCNFYFVLSLCLFIFFFTLYLQRVDFLFSTFCMFFNIIFSFYALTFLLISWVAIFYLLFLFAWCFRRRSNWSDIDNCSANYSSNGHNINTYVCAYVWIFECNLSASAQTHLINARFRFNMLWFIL